jgi:hypothetical protein
MLGCVSTKINLVCVPPRRHPQSCCQASRDVWKSESVMFQNHRCTRCELQMYLPTLDVLLLDGHIELRALFQSHISESVGRSVGHLMVDHTSPFGRHKRMSKLTFPLDAVSTLNRKSTWREIWTRLSCRSVSPLYPAVMNTRIRN